jgi:hypothetical protein
MAHTDPLPAGAAESVAAQLGPFLSGPALPPPLAVAPAAAPRLTESFAVCVVGAAPGRNPPADLPPLAEPAGLWHHQVRVGGAATHFARSARQGFGGTDLGVQEWADSPVAGRIDEAVTWVDQNVPEDATVRLLVVPAYYVHAFLIVRGDRTGAVLVDQPAGFTQLQPRREYPLREFLELLAKEQMAGTLT